MRTQNIIAVAAMALVGASACTSGVRQALGTERTAPDEFRVVTIAPLTVPPEYSLRPPAPGQLRAEDIFPDQQARRALFGDFSSENASRGEILLAARAGGADANPNVRALIDGETAAVVRKNESFADRLMFWEPDSVRPAADSDAPIDVEEERRRITEVTGGGDVIIVQPRRSGRKLPGL
ncbi:MAG: beta barrel protein insertion system lipoprotein component BamF [Oceanicaulis sp. HLUCCA04]|nr:MAG: beta barrel protein insertion system lipoprotein component BamF [Oceanicaulis sp. HLUCCA04]